MPRNGAMLPASLCRLKGQMIIKMNATDYARLVARNRVAFLCVAGRH